MRTNAGRQAKSRVQETIIYMGNNYSHRMPTGICLCLSMQAIIIYMGNYYVRGK